MITMYTRGFRIAAQYKSEKNRISDFSWSSKARFGNARFMTELKLLKIYVAYTVYDTIAFFKKLIVENFTD